MSVARGSWTGLHGILICFCFISMKRFFMVDRTRNGDELKEEFDVLGSTGNVSMSLHPEYFFFCSLTYIVGRFTRS